MFVNVNYKTCSIKLQERKKYQAECLLFAWIINTAIITINTIKIITMPIISNFTEAITL